MAAHLLDLIRAASPAPAQFLIAGIWQGVLLTAFACLCVKLYPRIGASARFVVWMIVFILLALLPFFALSGTALPPHAAAAVAAVSILHLSAGWAIALDCLWGIASLLSLATLVRQARQLRRLAAASTSIAPEALDGNLQRILSRAGSRPVRLCLSDAVDAPSVIGFLRPAIVIPQWLWGKLTPPELHQIVMHELAHLHRRDDWTNLAQKFLRALLPLNPALLWVERRLCIERERACDDAVLASSGVSPRDYAACLARFAENRIAEKRMLRQPLPLAPGAWARRSELAQRIYGILERKRQVHPWVSGGIVAASLCVYLCGALALARCPQMISFVPARQGVLPNPAARSAASSLAGLEARNASPTRFSSPARYQEASFRMPAAPRHRAAAPALPRTVSRRRRSSSTGRLPGAQFKGAQLKLAQFQVSPGSQGDNDAWIIFTVWRPALELPTLTLFQNNPNDPSDLSEPGFVIFDSHTNHWIVFQI